MRGGGARGAGDLGKDYRLPYGLDELTCHAREFDDQEFFFFGTVTKK